MKVDVPLNKETEPKPEALMQMNHLIPTYLDFKNLLHSKETYLSRKWLIPSWVKVYPVV